MGNNEELVTLLGNIQALLNEVSQALGSGQAQAGAQVNSAQKSVEATSDDAVNANDPAKTRLDGDNEEDSQKNKEELAKSIATAVVNQLKKQEEKKDEGKKDDKEDKEDKKGDIVEKSQNDKIISDIASAMKLMASNQAELKNQVKENETAVLNVLKALKIEDEVLKGIETPKAAIVQKGLNDSGDNEKMQTLLKSLLGKKEEEVVTDTPQKREEFVRKNMTDVNVLKYFTGQLGK
jgi:ATP-dependent Clp protease ATP-binding subunit ClpA